MPSTRDYKITVAKRLKHDPAFARATFSEALALLILGEPDVVRLTLADLIENTTGFKKIATKVGCKKTVLRELLSPTGAPSMDMLSSIFNAIRMELEIEVEIKCL